MRVARCLLIIVVVALTVQAQEQCRAASVITIIEGDRDFMLELGNDLKLHLRSGKDQLGWVVSVTPEGNIKEDWMFPVNLPLRTGESQFLATGYGESVRERMQYKHEIRFALTQSDYQQYARLATQTLESRDPDAAGRFLAEYRKMRAGTVVIEPLKYQTSSDGTQMEWAKLKFVVIVPKTFPGSTALKWRRSECAKVD